MNMASIDQWEHVFYYLLEHLLGIFSGVIKLGPQYYYVQSSKKLPEDFEHC